MKTNIRPVIIVTFLLLNVSFFNCCKDNDQSSNSFDSFTDPRDGNVYKCVKIGDQYWMAENLRYNPNIGLYTFYDHDSIHLSTYGYLYNYETADYACPNGWHLPGKWEWDQLIEYLGSENVAGGKLKEETNNYWFPPNTGATNESQFSALPGGTYNFTSDISLGMGQQAEFWTFKYPNDNKALILILSFDKQNSLFEEVSEYDSVGKSVRLVRNDLP